MRAVVRSALEPNPNSLALRLCLLVSAVFALIGWSGRAAASDSNPLKSVSFSDCHKYTCTFTIRFRLPSTFRAYGVYFGEVAGSGLGNATVSLNPYGLQPADVYLAHSTPTTWVITDLQLVSRADYNVFLLYAPTRDCKPATHNFYGQLVRGTVCTHIQHSAPLVMHLGVVPTAGPGALIGSSSASGAYPSASVSASVRSLDVLSSITVRVTSSVPGRNVHVNWEMICTRGSSVFSRSGSFDDVTPVNDDASINVPTADSCDLTVLASGDTNDDGIDSWSMTLKVYKL
jgi:hypothetical protein